MSYKNLMEIPYSKNSYAHPDENVRVMWRRKKIPKNLVGKYVYFLPWKYMNTTDVLDLTPNTLYKVINHDSLNLIRIRDDVGFIRHICLNVVSTAINNFPWLIAGRHTVATYNKSKDTSIAQESGN